MGVVGEVAGCGGRDTWAGVASVSGVGCVPRDCWGVGSVGNGWVHALTGVIHVVVVGRVVLGNDPVGGEGTLSGSASSRVSSLGHTNRIADWVASQGAPK
jgi:hypothetical protein